MKHIQINLNVLIHKVKLQVRFPCSLVAYLKVQNLEVAFGPEVPLRVGEAYLSLTASQKFSVFFDANRNVISQKKISICIYLTTSSGRIPAGAAYIPMSMLKKGTNKENLTIEKCPDKSAFIQASISYQSLNEIEGFSNLENITESSNGNGKDLFTLRDRNPGREGRSNPKTKFRSIQGTNYQSPKESHNNDVKNSFDKVRELQNSKVESQRGNYLIKNEVSESNNSTWAKARTGDRTDRQLFTSPPQVDYSSKLKVVQLEKELKNLQKKYDQSVVELKSIASKKDMLQRSLKEAEGQVRIFKQKCEDLQQSGDSIQKRNDYKQSSYKDQIKNLTEKLAASENQKQMMIYSKNDLVTEFEEREKTLRLSIREKEKQFTEEKNKLNKKNDQISKDLADLQAKLGENDLKIFELTKEANGQTRKNEILEERCQKLLLEIDQMKQSLHSEKNKREDLEDTLGSNLQLEEEKKKLKKKNLQQEQQISKLTKNSIQLESNNQKLLKKLEQSESALKDKINALKNLQKDSENLTKQSDSLRKNLEERQRRLEQMTLVKQSQTSKAESINDQLRQLQKKTQQEIRFLKKEIQDKDRQIQNLLRQSQDNVESINDYNTKLESMQVQLQDIKKSSNNSKIEYEELLTLKEKLQLDMSELKIHLSEEKASKQQLQLTLGKKIRDKENETRSLEENLKKILNNSAQREQEDAHRISKLQLKITGLESDLKDNFYQIEKLKNSIKVLQQEKSQGDSCSDELEYTLKLKNNEITFLKETVEKNNEQINDLTKENKEMSMKILKLQQKNTLIEIENEDLSTHLKEAIQNGSGTQQQLNNYIKSNNEKLSAFLNSLLSGLKIQFSPLHQEAEIQTLMQSAITKINLVYSNFEEQIRALQNAYQKLKSEVNELQLNLEQKIRQNDDLRTNLEDIAVKIRESSTNSDSFIKQLKIKLQNSAKEIKNFQNELASLKQINRSLSQQLDDLNNGLGSKHEENSSLKLKIEDLQEIIRQRQKQYSMTQSRQSSKFQEQSTTFKSIISELQDQTKKEANKCADLTSKLNEKTKQYKDLERKITQDIKKLIAENDKLNAQTTKQAKQLQAKLSLNTKYGEIETDLRAKLDQTNKEVAALKELNENIRKRNEKAAQKQKQQEAIIASMKNGQSQINNKQSDLEKAIKQRTAEFVVSREQNFKLEKQKQKFTQDLEIANAMIKVKEDTQKKMQAQIKNLEQQRATLKEAIKRLEIASTQLAKKNQKESFLLSETKDKLDKQLQEAKLKLEAAQTQLSKQYKNSKQANQQLTDQIKQLKLKNKYLQEKMVLANKSLLEQEKNHASEEKYLKPVRENLQALKVHLAQYSRTGDQFESNKNKLLKVANTKSEIPNEKYISDRMRDFSYAYNKLKIFILGCQLSEQIKIQAGEEMKKVQLTLDRVLRGDK